MSRSGRGLWSGLVVVLFSFGACVALSARCADRGHVLFDRVAFIHAVASLAGCRP
jgi:hypothetical protein